MSSSKRPGDGLDDTPESSGAQAKRAKVDAETEAEAGSKENANEQGDDGDDQGWETDEQEQEQEQEQGDDHRDGDDGSGDDSGATDDPGDSDGSDGSEDDDDDDDEEEEDTLGALLYALVSKGASTSQQAGGSSGPMSWLREQQAHGVDPYSIVAQLGLTVEDRSMPPNELWSALGEWLMKYLGSAIRPKLANVNTIDDAVSLIQRSKNIVFVTGAGISVSCGIPDFRSKNGVYARLRVDFPTLPDPQSMFDIAFFRQDPRPFYKFARELFPGNFKPSPSHYFISMLDAKGQLLRNYTQNIDTLEDVAGIKHVIQCHGSFATASCMVCKTRVDGPAIKSAILGEVIPKCTVCPPDDPLAIMKPDIVFFGEPLPQDFHSHAIDDESKVDLIVVMGSSLKVQPVASLPNFFPHSVPRILINREHLARYNFDVELLGNCDSIILELAARLGADYDLKAFAERMALPVFGEAPAWARASEADSASGSASGASSGVETVASAEAAITGAAGEVTAAAVVAVTEHGDEHRESNQDESDSDQNDDDSDGDGGKTAFITPVKEQGVVETYYFVPPNVYLFDGVEIDRL